MATHLQTTDVAPLDVLEQLEMGMHMMLSSLMVLNASKATGNVALTATCACATKTTFSSALFHSHAYKRTMALQLARSQSLVQFVGDWL